MIKKGGLILKIPKMKLVKSSNIDSIGYNPEEEQLFIKFKDGSLYVYKNVSEEVWKNFQKAESKGKFVYYELKDIYDYEKLWGDR